MKQEPEGDEGRRLASRRVADELRTAIESGTYPVGAALPPLRQLAEQHGVAVNTAMAAVRLLADEGYVTSKPNAANYVRDRSGLASPEQELRTMRAELGELRAHVHQLDAGLAAMDARFVGLVELISRPDRQETRPEG